MADLLPKIKDAFSVITSEGVKRRTSLLAHVKSFAQREYDSLGTGTVPVHSARQQNAKCERNGEIERSNWGKKLRNLESMIE